MRVFWVFVGCRTIESSLTDAEDMPKTMVLHPTKTVEILLWLVQLESDYAIRRA